MSPLRRSGLYELKKDHVKAGLQSYPVPRLYEPVILMLNLRTAWNCPKSPLEILLHLVYENCLITSHITALVHDVIIYGQDRFMVNQYALFKVTGKYRKWCNVCQSLEDWRKFILSAGQ